MKSHDLNGVVDHIAGRLNPSQILIVGVDGMTCSGKTILASRISAELIRRSYSVCNVSIDNFCNIRSFRYRDDESDALQVYKYNFDERSILNMILKPARNDCLIDCEFMALDPPSNKYLKPISYKLKKGGILIFEGLFLFKRLFVDYFDYKILIDVSEREQLRRARVRDLHRGNLPEEIEPKYVKRYRPSFYHYLEHDAPLHVVDLVINNDNWEYPVLHYFDR